MSRLSVSSPRRLVGFGLLAFALFVVAAAGLSAVPSYTRMRAVLGHFDPIWLCGVFGGIAVALGGYQLAWRGIDDHPGAPELTARQRRAIVTAGFGGFIAGGGSALDKRAMLAAGAEERSADVRVAAIDALEHLPLAAGCWVAAVFLLAAGRGDPPPLDFIWPWAVAPPIGALLASIAVRRRPAAWRGASGWRRWVGIALDGVAFFGEMLGRPAGRLGALGMSASFAGQMFALWTAIRCFGFGASVPTVILCDAIGYVLTRRSAPLAGAGFIDCCLALCLWDCNVPLAVAIAGVFTYRFVSVFLLMPASWRAIRVLDELEGAPRPGAEASPSAVEGPSLPAAPAGGTT